MRYSILRSKFGLVFLMTLIAIVPQVAAQSTPKKTSIWQQMKDAAKQGAQQGRPQQQPQQPGQNPGQPQQRPSRPGQQQQAGQVNDSGPFKPPAGTKIEEKVLAPVQEGASFEVSPHGVHVATVSTDGSRAVVFYDGVVGPKFDQILALPSGRNARIAFSPDGNRYAYCARLGDQYVVMVDGKELLRSSESAAGNFDGESCHLNFTSNSKHVYYTSHVSLGNQRGQSFTRFVFDGKPSPTGSAGDVAFSPDGDHYAYNLTISDPYHQDRYALVVDGKVAPYMAGAPQWTADSKHLYTQTQQGQATELLLDGKPLMRAFGFQVHIPPVGDMVVVAVTGGTTFHPFSFLAVGGKKVPGSDTVERGSITQVVFSADGKHYAAVCGDSNNHQYVITDGKRGQEYTSVDKLAFTADSSTVVYTTYINGKNFIVVGDQEFGSSIGSVQPPVIAPTGNRVAAFIRTNGTPTLLIDRKVIPLNARDGQNLSFTPDGAHYAYFATDAGMGSRLVMDGVPQPQSALSGDTIDMQNPSALKYIFSADSKHVAHFANSAAGDAHGVFLDGKFIPASLEGTNTDLSFSPDSKHLFWIHAYGNRPYRVFIDGKPLVDFYSAGNTLATIPHWWDFGPDGTLSFLTQDDNSLKRITITFSPETSLATMLGGGTTVASGR